MTAKLSDLKAVLEGMEMVDLTFTMEVGMPSWPTHPRFYHDVVESYDFGDVACHYQLVMGEHSGTHFDAPLHFIPEGERHYGADKVALDALMGRAATIPAAEVGANGLVTVDFIKNWEKANGNIEAGDIVLFHFGWDRLWGIRQDGADFLKDWPGLARDGAEYLAQKEVKAVGTDALALDVFTTTDNPAHRTLLAHGILVIENLNNLGELPAFSYFMALPLKIKGGSGSPIRAIALKPKA